MMAAAKKELDYLEYRMTWDFPLSKHAIKETASSPHYRFQFFVEESLRRALHEFSKRLLTLDPTSHNLPGWFLITHLNQLNIQTQDNFACTTCFSTNSQPSANGLESPQDTCGELLLLQHRIICCDKNDIESWQAHIDFSQEVQKQAIEMFEFELRQVMRWERGERYGVYHPGGLYRCIPSSTEDLNDSLARSPLHMWMDDDDGYRNAGLNGFSHDVSSLKNMQDILGRTALTMACQERWKDAVEWLLKENADPGLATIYGSLPLHYAAVKGSFNICEQLLAHKTRFDIKAKDCMYKTALDYAREKEHQDVVYLLSAEYAAADGEDEELSQARSLQAGIESDGEQGSYLV